MADKIEQTPLGPIRIPDALGDGTLSQRGLVTLQGARVEITFFNVNIDPAGDPDGAVGEGVAKIWMSRDDFAAMAAMYAEIQRQIEGLQPE